MFEIILTNFSLLFAFTVLIFWPKMHHAHYKIFHYFTKPQYNIFIGINFGIVGLLLGYLTLNYFNGALYNARIILVLFSGILGGPMAIFVSGILMNLGRLFLFPLNDLSFLMSLNSFILLFVLTYIAYKYRIHFKNIHLYLYFSLIELSFVILIYFKFSFYSVQFVLLISCFTIVTFWAIFWVVSQSQRSSEQARDLMALRQVDFLTQLPNHYAIEAHLKNLFDQNAVFSFIHLDIQNFKTLNKEHSYLIGDAVLKQLAAVLKQCNEDKQSFIGRLSGEEFCFVVKTDAPILAIHKAYEILQTVENTTFGETFNLDLPIECSIGITTSSETISTVEDIFQTANLALLAAKKDAHNDICHYNQYLKSLEN